MAAFPLDSLVTLTALNFTRFDEPVWRRHAPRWPLLQCVRLGPPAAHGFRELLLNDNGGREGPLLPSLTKLVLVNTGLSKRRTLRICDALMQRVEQGVPFESLDLRTCIGTTDAVRLLREIVVDVSDAKKPYHTRGPLTPGSPTIAELANLRSYSLRALLHPCVHPVRYQRQLASRITRPCLRS